MKRTVFRAFIVLSLIVSCVPADTHLPLMSGAAATAPLSTAALDSIAAQAPALLSAATSTATLSSPPPLRQLPTLYVDGPYVKRSDTNAPVWLKGVNVEEFRQPNPHTFSDLYNVQGLAIVMGQAWGINLLRVAVDPESVETATSEYEALIDFAQEHGMYVILTPFASAVNPFRDDERLPVPDELVATAMSYLAARFKDRTNVLFGLWNEPHPDSIPSISYEKQWQTWMDAGIKVASAIRSSHPGSILVVPGGNKWARDMTYYQNHPFPFDNVIYDVHDYWAYPGYHYTRAMWTWAIAKYPLLIGEFGGDPTNPTDYADIDYMQETFRIVNANSGLVHYTVYALTADGVWGIFNRHLSNMPKGNALRFDLSVYPPTRFR
jgi:Cellulase (glycosyl hydrolase family 5)